LSFERVFTSPWGCNQDSDESTESKIRAEMKKALLKGHFKITASILSDHGPRGHEIILNPVKSCLDGNRLPRAL
jgi:hypothetical protein